MNKIQNSHHTRGRQQGFALIMSLVFLVLLTIIGITAMNTSNLEEKMAGNVKDKNLAFQSAEAAVVAGENWLYSLISKPIFPQNTLGLYTLDSTAAQGKWETISWSAGTGYTTFPNTPSQTISGGLNNIQTQPKFIIEDMGEIPDTSGSLAISSAYKGKGKSMMRITGRGTGGTDAAVSVVQTTYARYY